MDFAVVILTLLGLLFFFLGSTVWVGFSMLIVGILAMSWFTNAPALSILTNALWNNTNSATMLALPLFIFMGEILYRSKIAESLFKGLLPWMTFLPGRLLHINVIGCGLFAAVSGSSSATAVTVGKISMPELLNRNYSLSLSVGTLAGAATLGLLIPPSMVLIVYGIMANVSIGQLFIAGIVPGIMIMAFFSLYVIIRCLINPSLAPKEVDSYTWMERLKALKYMLPVILLIIFVLGSIYTGVATPTEAASLGVVGALMIAYFTGGLNRKTFQEAMLGAIKTNGMIMLIVIGAFYLTITFGYLRIPAKLTAYISSLGLSPYELIGVMVIMYLIVGMFLDGLSIIVMTLPLALPLVTQAGFDPLWFGIFVVIMIEISQITPPVGFNLFVINDLVKKVDVLKIAYYSLPSFIMMLIVVAILTVFPEIVHWLPNLMAK